jgi:hypothetical protein
MACMADGTALAVSQQKSQQASMEDAQDDYAAQQRRQNDLGLAGYGGYGGAPQYGAGTVPKRDYGYEEYLNHILATTQFDPSGTAINGRYAGKHQAEIIDMTRDDYPKLAPEERQKYEQRRFNANDRSPAEMQDQGFQYQNQTAQWGATGPTWADGQQQPQNSPSSRTFDPAANAQRVSMEGTPGFNPMGSVPSGQRMIPRSLPNQNQAAFPNQPAQQQGPTSPQYQQSPQDFAASTMTDLDRQQIGRHGAGGVYGIGGQDQVASDQPEMTHQPGAIPQGQRYMAPNYTSVNQAPDTTYNSTNVQLSDKAQGQIDQRNMLARQQPQGPPRPMTLPAPQMTGLVPHPSAQIPMSPNYAQAGPPIMVTPPPASAPVRT